MDIFNILKLFKTKSLRVQYDSISYKIDEEVFNIFKKYNEKIGKNTNKTMCIDLHINGEKVFNIKEYYSNLWLTFWDNDEIILYKALSIVDRLNIMEQLKRQLEDE